MNKIQIVYTESGGDYTSDDFDRLSKEAVIPQARLSIQDINNGVRIKGIAFADNNTYVFSTSVERSWWDEKEGAHEIKTIKEYLSI